MAAARSTPSWLRGKSNAREIEGQATPRTPSGTPRLANATNAMTSSGVPGRRSTSVRHAIRVRRFGDDSRTLYLVAQTGLYRIRLGIPGIRGRASADTGQPAPGPRRSEEH